jgi:predicted dehydrogenase
LNGRRKAFEIIRSGEIGKIIHAKYNFRAPHRGDPNLPWTWWSDEKMGGGALGAIGSHAFDTLRWITGAEITSIFCQLQTHVKERRDEKSGEVRAVTTDDETNMLLRFADGEFVKDATANVSLSMVEYPIYQNRVEVFGTKGAVRVEFDGEIFVGKKGLESWEKLDIELNRAVEGVKNTGWNNGFLAFAEPIIKALQNGETAVENAATFEDGYRNQILLDAARESNEKGSVVKLAS